MGKRPSRACLRNQRRDKHTSCYCLPNERIFCAMADVKVTCVCGAIYEVIKTVGPSRETRPYKCVLCDRELFASDGDNVGQLHLVWRPDEDRE